MYYAELKMQSTSQFLHFSVKNEKLQTMHRTTIHNLWHKLFFQASDLVKNAYLT